MAFGNVTFGMTAPSILPESGGGCTAGTAVCIADIISRTALTAIPLIRAPQSAFAGGAGIQTQPVFVQPAPVAAPSTSFFSTGNLPILLLLGLGAFLLLRK